MDSINFVGINDFCFKHDYSQTFDFTKQNFNQPNLVLNRTTTKLKKIHPIKPNPSHL
jgi:hypothetical protein